MTNTAQIQAYCLWLKERGLPYLVPSASRPVREEIAEGVAVVESFEDPALGYGSQTARVVFIGDGAFPETAATGKAFAGEERELLDKMIAAMNLGQGDFYVSNALVAAMDPASPPDTRQLENCREHLAQMIARIDPDYVVVLGGLAARAVLGPKTSFQVVRGRWQSVAALGHKEVLTTYHPRDLIRFPGNKRHAWADLKIVMSRLQARNVDA